MAKKKAAKKKAVKKRAQRKPVKNSVFDDYRNILHGVCVDYICRNLEDLKFYQRPESTEEGFKEAVSTAIDVDSCYINLNAGKNFTQFVGFAKKLPKKQVHSELEEALNFNPFKHKGLLPHNLSDKNQYTLEDIQKILGVLDEALDDPGSFNPARLRGYVQAQHMMDIVNEPEKVSLHPYVVAMTFTGKHIAKEKRLRFRYVAMGALQKEDMVGKLMEKDLWKIWAHRKMDDEKNILAVEKDIDGLFAVPCVSTFCTVAEQLGKEYKNSSRRSKDHYSTEGFQAYENYVKVVNAYKRLLGQKKHSGSGAGEE